MKIRTTILLLMVIGIGSFLAYADGAAEIEASGTSGHTDSTVTIEEKKQGSIYDYSIRGLLPHFYTS